MTEAEMLARAACAALEEATRRARRAEREWAIANHRWRETRDPADCAAAVAARNQMQEAHAAARGAERDAERALRAMDGRVGRGVL